MIRDFLWLLFLYMIFYERKIAMVFVMLAVLVFVGVSISYVFREGDYPTWMNSIRKISTGVALTWSWLILGRTFLVVNSAAGLILPIEAVKALNILLGQRSAGVMPWIVCALLANNCILQVVKGCYSMRVRQVITVVCLAAANGYMQTTQAEIWKWISLISMLMGVVAYAAKAIRKSKIEKIRNAESELTSLEKLKDKIDKRIAVLQQET